MFRQGLTLSFYLYFYIIFFFLNSGANEKGQHVSNESAVRSSAREKYGRAA